MKDMIYVRHESTVPISYIMHNAIIPIMQNGTATIDNSVQQK